MEHGDTQVLELRHQPTDHQPSRDERNLVLDNELDHAGQVTDEHLGEIHPERFVGEISHGGDLALDRLQVAR